MKKLNNNGKIYMYTNKINGKVYIGQTVQKIEDRAKKNGLGYKESPRFNNAINKYGWDNFEVTILKDNIDTIEELNKFEIEYIQKYNSTNEEFGYNIAYGGFTGLDKLNSKPIDQYDLQFNFIKHYSSINEAARFNKDYYASMISMCARHECKSAYGFRWCFSDEKLEKDNYKDLREENLYRSVDQYSLDGEYIQTFDLLADACEYLGRDRRGSGSITGVCKGAAKTAFGYQWKYHDDPKEIKPFTNSRWTKVLKYDKDWNYIDSYDNKKLAATSCNGKNTQRIKQCCEGKIEFAYGFRWKYA